MDEAKLKASFVEFCVKNGRSTEADALAEFDQAVSDRITARIMKFFENRRSESGVVCFSAVPNSIRMWSYYAQSHEGVCFGYDSNFGPFNVALKVLYQNPDAHLDLIDALNTDPALLTDHVSLRKAAEWEFEQEHRLSVGQIGSNARLLPFHPESISEIRLGARIKDAFRCKVLEAIKRLPHRPKLIQMNCDLDRFVLTETELTDI